MTNTKYFSKYNLGNKCNKVQPSNFLLKATGNLCSNYAMSNDYNDILKYGTLNLDKLYNFPQLWELLLEKLAH